MVVRMEVYTVSIDRKECKMTEDENQYGPVGWFNNDLFHIVQPFITVEDSEKGKYRFENLDRDAAIKLLFLLPEWFKGFVDVAPNVIAVLHAADICPGIRLGGYVNLAPRRDEGIVIDTIAIPETDLGVAAIGTTLEDWHWALFRTRAEFSEKVPVPPTFELSNTKPLYWIASWEAADRCEWKVWAEHVGGFMEW